MELLKQPSVLDIESRSFRLQSLDLLECRTQPLVSRNSWAAGRHPSSGILAKVERRFDSRMVA
ncbi:hypothetical protein [Ramlibacter pinisoli]|uniref:hypothetical protein n=1 Tax=Ramlibacter sp. CGMCC 1.13660 TaxID=2755558 RepID=UPI0012F756AA|nr:hypothetical protein [Ramlibacter sp. CGMCC 1.13660]